MDCSLIDSGLLSLSQVVFSDVPNLKFQHHVSCFEPLLPQPPYPLLFFLCYSILSGMYILLVWYFLSVSPMRIKFHEVRDLCFYPVHSVASPALRKLLAHTVDLNTRLLSESKKCRTQLPPREMLSKFWGCQQQVSPALWFLLSPVQVAAGTAPFASVLWWEFPWPEVRLWWGLWLGEGRAKDRVGLTDKWPKPGQVLLQGGLGSSFQNPGWNVGEQGQSPGFAFPLSVGRKGKKPGSVNSGEGWRFLDPRLKFKNNWRGTWKLSNMRWHPSGIGPRSPLSLRQSRLSVEGVLISANSKILF